MRAPSQVVVSSCTALLTPYGVSPSVWLSLCLAGWCSPPLPAVPAAPVVHPVACACCPCRPCLLHLSPLPAVPAAPVVCPASHTLTRTRACCAAGFLSLDTDGRVVRVDTLAKLLGPGFRLGWLSGPPPLVAKLGLYMAGISIGANMVSQVSKRWAH